MLNIADFQNDILQWYHRQARTFSWRMPPHAIAAGQYSDAYHVWLSEIMLQQTVTTTVEPYFQKFIRLYPTIHDLATAPLDDVLHAWAGLGYYSRARNLHHTAQKIAFEYHGKFPQTIQELKTLKGVGDYTAGAIFTIAFGKPATVIDGNIHRILTRLFALEGVLPDIAESLKNYADMIMPPYEVGNYVQALMDLGATICIPKTPRCELCPVKQHCRAFASDTTHIFPEKAVKAEKPIRYGTCFIIKKNQQILIEKQPAKGLFGGLYLLPFYEKNSDSVKSPAPAPIAFENTDDIFSWHQTCEGHFTYACKPIKHIFTHFTLYLDVIMLESDIITLKNNQSFVDIDKITNYAMPSLMKKVFKSCTL